ncbi:hypothetical protein [Streptomyces sp. NL15-2K]|uniref:recombination directionality factor n=1 Tax=Streptomyces sp. NL15-2K TaxID=376149 RepID=UPI0035B5281C
MLRDEWAGHFHSGRSGGRRPEGLKCWRVTSERAEVVECLREAFGGEIRECRTGDSFTLDLLTCAERVNVILTDEGSIRTEMVMWGPSGIRHHCDGVRFLSPDEKRGTRCGCPAGMADRRNRAMAGRGPQVSAEISFRVARFPDLGEFRFRSSSWRLMEAANSVRARFPVEGSEIICDLALEPAAFALHSGLTVIAVAPSIKVPVPDG